jgi:transposase
MANEQITITQVEPEKCPKGLKVECPECGAENKPEREGHYFCWYCKKVFLVAYMRGKWMTF